MLGVFVPSILDLSLEELRAWLSGHGQPAYREAQIHGWIFQRRAAAFDEMSDLPQPLRRRSGRVSQWRVKTR